MWEYFIITWLVLCPIGSHPVEVETTSYSFSCGDVNLIECPTHHLALWARPMRGVRIRKVISPIKNNPFIVAIEERRDEAIFCDKK